MCDGDMGMNDKRLSDEQISVSSVLKEDLDNYGPALARLGSSSSWRPNNNAQTEWIMVIIKITKTKIVKLFN